MRNRLRQPFKWILLSLATGLFAGLASAAFLWLLDLATKARQANPWLLWFLPLGGFLIGWIYHRFGQEAAQGNNLILDEIHDPKKILPLRMAPLVFFGTILTHFFGGSAGREGTAVQMGASLADQLSKWARIELNQRRVLLVAGAGAGFGAAIGAPFAGALFGMEVIYIGTISLFAPFECLIASFTAYFTTLALHAPHSHYPLPALPAFGGGTIFYILLADIAFGLCARIFVFATHLVERAQQRLLPFPPLRPLAGGILLLLLFRWEGSSRFLGLGIEEIQKAFQAASGFEVPALKAAFTALTVGSGFKGGEFIPLVFIGATAGSALSLLLPLPASFLAALGFASVFAAAANTPLACACMAMEIFGFAIGPYALLACCGAYLLSGHRGIYGKQRIKRKKPLP